MLKPEKIQQVRNLLAEGGHSQRMIARLSGVSRAVVQRIASGKRKDRVIKPPEAWEDDWTGRPYERCPLCGAMARLPCLACIIRSLPKETAVPVFREPMILGLDLEEKHYSRYKQVRAWRETQQDPDFVEVPENWPFRKRWKNIAEPARPEQTE